MKNLIYRYIYRPFRRLNNVISYAIQGWQTEDWDYAYLLKDLEFKIKRMKKYLNKEGIVDRKTLTSMEKVLHSLNRWQNDDHYKKHEEEVEKLYGKRRWYETKLENGYTRCLFRFDKETNENEQQIQKACRIAQIRGGLDELKAKNEFFQLLKEFIESWWS